MAIAERTSSRMVNLEFRLREGYLDITGREVAQAADSVLHDCIEAHGALKRIPDTAGGDNTIFRARAKLSRTRQQVQSLLLSPSGAAMREAELTIQRPIMPGVLASQFVHEFSSLFRRIYEDTSPLILALRDVASHASQSGESYKTESRLSAAVVVIDRIVRMSYSIAKWLGQFERTDSFDRNSHILMLMERVGNSADELTSAEARFRSGYEQPVASYEERRQELLGRIAAGIQLVGEIEASIQVMVDEARDLRASWQEIGTAAGLTENGAYRRWDPVAREKSREKARRSRERQASRDS